jgi:hypothetical protein
MVGTIFYYLELTYSFALHFYPKSFRGTNKQDVDEEANRTDNDQELCSSKIISPFFNAGRANKYFRT